MCLVCEAAARKRRVFCLVCCVVFCGSEGGGWAGRRSKRSGGRMERVERAC